MPKIDFYGVQGSAPCRTVLMVAKALGVDVNFILTDLSKGEHLTPEYIKMNPQHTVPTINDNGFILWESRAIIAYLVSQYGKNDSLYPKDAKKRAVVDQKLYFDTTTLSQRFAEYFYPLFQGGKADPAKYQKLEEGFKLLDSFLEGQKWVAGENITIADYALVATVSTIEAIDFPVNNYPNVKTWLDRMNNEAPGIDINKEGVAMMKKFVTEKLSSFK